MKKRDYSESQLNHHGQGLTPKQTTPYYTFEDSSTVKPNDNTIIRNPTLMFKFGQDQQNLNRSQLIKPINLSKIEFEDQEAANSNYVSAKSSKQIHSDRKINKDPHPQRDYTTKEISDFCTKVSFIINDIMNSESDKRVQDLALNQSEGRLYEILPQLSVISNSLKLPAIIQNEFSDPQLRDEAYVDYGFLEGVNAAYFCFGKNLYLWYFQQLSPDNYIRQIKENQAQQFKFDQMVTSITLASILPGMSSNQTDQILIVASVTQIQIFYFIKNQRDNKVELINSGVSVPTDQNIVSKIIQFKKNGRVFYGGSSGHVNELKFKDSSNFDIISLIQGERKKLVKNDHQSENILRKLLPGFLKFKDNKSITDIKIDEQRNILYSISISQDQDSLNETIIEVFDLGILSNKFEKLAVLRQSQIVEMMFEFWQKERSLRKGDLSKISQEHKIIYVQPIQVSESDFWHLLLVTQNGYRIFINFATQVVPLPSKEEQQQEYANSDHIIRTRFTHEWNIVEIMHFPEQDSFQDFTLLNKQPGVFFGGQISSAAQALNLDGQSILYDGSQGTFSFVQNKDSSFEPIPGESCIILNQIKKNESTIAYMKQFAEAGSVYQSQKLIECFAQLIIPQDRAAVPSKHFTPSYHREEQLQLLNETVIEMQSIQNVNSLEIQKLLGLKKSYFESKGKDATPYYENLCLSEFEKQVYLLPNSLNMLTDQRIVEIKQLRPIDLLMMLLQSMIDNRSNYLQNDNMEEFLDLYSIRETCAMLLQIVAERDNYYIQSRKVEEALSKSKKRDQLGQPRQLMSKSSQLMLNRRISNLDHTQIQDDQIRFRKATPETRNIALQLLRKYGDTILHLRQDYDIQDDALEGMPSNIQDFSLKHYSLYLYLQRILRPIWGIKLAFQSPHSKDKFYRGTFDSLIIPQSKLHELLQFIETNTPILFGEVFTPNLKSNEKLFTNQALFNMVLPVHGLRLIDKQRLELMEKNSLKNLKLFISRCIQAIDMISILTFENDQKMFVSLQKAINDKAIVYQFAETTFKDLITIESNAIIKRFLEAAVQVETQGKDEAQSKMRQRYAQINRLCSTFFSKNENIAFIGITLLQAARKERSLQKKEELLRQAIDHLSDKPLNIDMNSLPELLVENGNYTSLADLTLRKIKALEALPLDQRERFMSEREYQDQLEHCYSIILSLFAAIDQSITNNKDLKEEKTPKDNDLIQYFLSKLNAIHNEQLKINLRDKIMRRIEQFNDKIVMMAMFDYLISRPNPNLNIETLPLLNEKYLFDFIDKAIKSDGMQRAKFDSIVKLLMKKNEADRLCTLTISACYDRYNLVKSSGEPIQLTVQNKMDLINTAKIVLEEKRSSINSDAFINHEKNLQTIENQLQFQFIVLDNIQEVIKGLENKVAEAEKIGNRDPQDDLRIASLNQLYSNLQEKIIQEDVLLKDCQLNQLNESVIRNYMRKSIQNPRYQEQIINESNKLINFIKETYPKDWVSWMLKKMNLFTQNTNLLKRALILLQKQVEDKFQNSNINQELNMLLNNESLINSRFEVIDYAYTNLVSYLTPYELYSLFSQNIFQVGNQQILFTDHLKEVVKRFAIINIWMQIHLQKVNNPQVNAEAPIFMKDLKDKGLEIFRNGLQPFKRAIQNDDVLLNLEKEQSQLLTNLIKSVSDKFQKLLQDNNLMAQNLERIQHYRTDLTSNLTPIKEQKASSLYSGSNSFGQQSSSFRDQVPQFEESKSDIKQSNRLQSRQNQSSYQFTSQPNHSYQLPFTQNTATIQEQDQDMNGQHQSP